MSKAARLKELRRKKNRWKVDKTFSLLCEGLRNFVENINRSPDLALRGETYGGIDPTAVQVVEQDGVQVGYKLEDHGVFFRRKVFVVFKGYDLDEIPDEQKDPIMLAVLETMIDRGESLPSVVRTAKDCVMIEQDFMPLLLAEKNPDLVSISNMPTKVH